VAKRCVFRLRLKVPSVCIKEVYRLVRVAGRGNSDGVCNLEVMVESLSAGSRPEIQEEGRVMELKIFL